MDTELILGFEIHTELKTASKIFCGCPTVFGAPPNTQVCPVCLGLPGVLPVLNERAVEFALRTALALGCDIPGRATFDRKNYHYPDLPKNYQISQNYHPFGTGGAVEITLRDGTAKRIRINNIHLEEDAGKLLHSEIPGADWSVVDLNRAGVPLIEIVTEPDFRTPEEAQVFMQTMRSILRYIDVSDCKMQEGSLRFEANISVRRRGDTALGPKVEIKNLNSTKTVLRCIEHEFERQTEMLERGERVAQETRLWDEVRGCTVAMRSKEFANDYRYFPDPDLVPVLITAEMRERVAASLPELPAPRRRRFAEEFGLPEYDAAILTVDRAVADYFEEAVRTCGKAKPVSNIIMTDVLAHLNDHGLDMEDFPVPARSLAALIGLMEEGVISTKIAKTVLRRMIETGKEPRQIVEEEGLVQISDTPALEAIVDQVIAANAAAAEEYRAGKDKAKGRLVGEIMKASRGKANPALVNELIDRRLRG